MTPDNKEPLSEPPPSPPGEQQQDTYISKSDLLTWEVPPGTYNVKDCVRKHKFGIYPNINDPSKFFMCSKSGPLEMKCREGLEFDPEAFGCNRPKTTPPPPPPGQHPPKGLRAVLELTRCCFRAESAPVHQSVQDRRVPAQNQLFQVLPLLQAGTH